MHALNLYNDPEYERYRYVFIRIQIPYPLILLLELLHQVMILNTLLHHLALLKKQNDRVTYA